MIYNTQLSLYISLYYFAAFFSLEANDGSNVQVTCETLLSEEVPDFGGPQRQFRPRPVTSSPSVDHEVATATHLPAAAEDAAMPEKGNNDNGFNDYVKTSQRQQDSANAAADHAGFRLHDIEVMPVQPWLPAWLDDDDESAGNEPEAANVTADGDRQPSTRSPVGDPRQPFNAAGRRPAVSGSVGAADVIAQQGNPVAAGVPFLHRGQLVEHRIQDIGRGVNNHQNNYWFDLDNETRKSAAAIVGDGSEIFENRDFSRARESLKYNVDEGVSSLYCAPGVLSQTPGARSRRSSVRAQSYLTGSDACEKFNRQTCNIRTRVPFFGTRTWTWTRGLRTRTRRLGTRLQVCHSDDNESMIDPFACTRPVFELPGGLNPPQLFAQPPQT
jgi:hypothetical protein